MQPIVGNIIVHPRSPVVVAVFLQVVFLSVHDGTHGLAGVAQAFTKVGLQSGHRHRHHVTTMRHRQQGLRCTPLLPFTCADDSSRGRSRNSACSQTWHNNRLSLRRTAASSASMMMASSNPEDLVRPGCMVAYDPDTKGGSPVLGLAVDRVGKKKNTFTVAPAATAASGSSATVAVGLRQIVYIVPGGDRYSTADLVAFEQDSQVDVSLLEDAWQILLEEGMEHASEVGSVAEGEAVMAGTSDPRGMAELIFGDMDPNPKQCYQAFRLLQGEEGTLRFKRRRDGRYEARSR